MNEITLEKVHDMLEKLAAYVMNEVPTRREMNERFEQIDKRFEEIDRRFEQIDKRFEQIDKRFEQIDRRFEQIDKRFDSIGKQLEIIRSQQSVFTKTFEWHNERLELLEGDNSDPYRIRDKEK